MRDSNLSSDPYVCEEITGQAGANPTLHLLQKAGNTYKLGENIIKGTERALKRVYDVGIEIRELSHHKATCSSSYALLKSVCLCQLFSYPGLSFSYPMQNIPAILGQIKM